MSVRIRSFTNLVAGSYLTEVPQGIVPQLNGEQSLQFQLAYFLHF